MMGERVKYLRKVKGLTQQELAERTRLSQSYISAIEQGTKIPTLYTLDLIAGVLEVESVDLIASREMSLHNSLSRV